MTQDSQGLKQALVEQPLFSILQKYPYPDLRLAFGQSLFPVEVSLHDDAAVPVLSGANIPGEPLYP